MESNPKTYDFEASFARIDQILNQADVAYEEVKSLPDRSSLTFANGYYAHCSALFVDIRDSSELPSKYKRPSLARLYRAYISELVAVMNRDPNCREINIVGDCVWSVVNTPKKTDIDYVFSTAAKCNSLVDTLNSKLEKRRMKAIRVGIGLDYGRALMIKAGYSGSGINDVVYMGDVVNSAAKHASLGGKSLFSSPMIVGHAFQQNLNDHNRGLLRRSGGGRWFEGNAIDVAMNDWRRQHYP